MVWRNVKLGHLLIQRESRIPVEPGALYKQITVRLWGKGLSLRGVVDGSEIAAESQVAVQPGDFLISKIDARHGAFGLVPDELAGGVVSNDFPCFEIDRSKVDPSYLEWFVRTEQFIAICREASKGSTNRVRLKERVFLELEIPLPTLPEQQAISSRLNATSDTLAGHKTQTSIILDEASSLLHSAFSRAAKGCNFEPLAVVAPLERRPVDVEPDEEYPELGARSFGRGLFHKPHVLGSTLTWQKLFWIHEGDLVFSNIKAWEGAFGVAGKADHLRVGSHRYLTCVPQPELVSANFVWFYLQTAEGLEKVGRASPGSADRNRTLGQRALMEIEIPVPKLEKQKKFDELQLKVKQLVHSQKLVSNEIDKLLPSMLHEIFVQQTVNALNRNSRSNKRVAGTKVVRTRTVKKPFDEAVLVGAVIKAFVEDDGRPLGNFRLQKGVYFARRHMGEKTLDQEFLRKAAGPYNPKMRYSGGVKIAEENGWILRSKGTHGEGSALGDKASELDSWIEKYQFDEVAAWVRDKFKYRKNDQWELLATVDYARLALETENEMSTSAAVLSYIEADDEWRPKLQKLGLSESLIQNALVELETLFPNTETSS